MSERPSTFDLDRAFDDLTRDVSGVSAVAGGRGAARAVTASRRRRAVGAGAAAVVVLTAGGLALTTLGDDPARTVPVAPDVPDLPDAVTPAPLTAEALAAATSPWRTAWVEEDATAFTDPPCISAGGAEPLLQDTTELTSGPRVSAERTYAAWESPARAGRVADRLAASFEQCSEGEMVGTTVAVPGAEVTAYAWPEGNPQLGVLWVAVVEDRLALLTVAGVGDPPADVRDRVGEALVAGLTYGQID